MKLFSKVKTKVDPNKLVLSFRYADICDFTHSIQYPTPSGAQLLISPVDEFIAQLNQSTLETISVYIKTDFITQLLPILSSVNKKIILFTGSSDLEINFNIFNQKPTNVVKWFAENVNYKHKDLIPTPIGSLAASWIECEGTQIIDYRVLNHKSYEAIKIQKKPFLNLVFSAFSLNTNPQERKMCYDYLKDKNFSSNYISGETHDRKLSEEQFYQIMSQHRFVMSPPGNGIDCGRTWGALQIGCIPIAQESVLVNYLKQYAPIFSYKNINEVTEEKLLSFEPKWKRGLNIMNIEYYKKEIQFIKQISHGNKLERSMV